MSHRVVVIDISMSTFEAVLPAVMIGGSAVDEGRVNTEIVEGIIISVEFVKII
jgi:hypothetical protein